MDLLKKPDFGEGYLNGHFLIAMPGMADDRFARAVIYICAHSDAGAMGFVINQQQQLGFVDLLEKIGVLSEEESIIVPQYAQNIIVHNGGPVDRNRGFVLHSDDYSVETTMPVSEDICLTATVDVLKAIYQGKGPRQILMTLGYSGWASGQLETEILDNGWLTCCATNELLFDHDISTKYDRLISHMGIDLARLVTVAGNA